MPPPPTTPPPPLPPPPYDVARQLGNYLHGPQDDEERRPGRTRAQTRTHQSGLLSMLLEERGISKALAGQRPPHQPTAELPACPASELSQPTSYAEACASHHAPIWREAMLKVFNGLEATGTFGSG